MELERFFTKGNVKKSYNKFRFIFVTENQRKKISVSNFYLKITAVEQKFVFQSRFIKKKNPNLNQHRIN